MAKINLKHIRNNAQSFADLSASKLCAVVKANAYGHGAEEVVNALEAIVDYFAVALIEEAIAIRTAACGKEILVFTPPMTEEQVICIAQNGFIATVPDLWTAKLVFRCCEKYGLNIKVHLKINTGMNRYGMNVFMLGKVCKLFKKGSFIKVEGIYSHLYEYTLSRAKEQKALFERALLVCKRYFPNVIAHLGGTYATLLGKDFAFDMVRIGLGLYGYLPAGMQDVDDSVCKLQLQKAMAVYTVTVSDRQYRFGGKGYGSACTNEEKKDLKRLSVCRFGYADGFLRKKENGVAEQQQNANTLCMDVCIRKNAKRRGQVVPILIDADETAKATGTISYEVLCAATRRAEFIYENE